MIFHQPLFLLAFVVVAAVAAWMLYRPGRCHVVVGSVALWSQAVASLDKSSSKPIRAISASWALLLAGCTLATLAAAGPSIISGTGGRTIALAIYPSAELASPKSLAKLRDAADSIIDKLDPADRVQLLIPCRDGGMYLSPRQAKDAVGAIAPLALRAERISLPPVGADVQQVFCISPAGARLAVPTSWRRIEITPMLPTATIDAISADVDAKGQVKLFVAAALHGDPTAPASLRVEWNGGSRDFPLAGRGGETICDLPACDWIQASVCDSAGDKMASAFLARRDFVPIKLAMLGDELPMVRRFAAACGYIEIVDKPGLADVIVANASQTLPAKPALVIKSPVSPPGWMLVSAGQNVVLSDANVAADLLTAGADFSSLAVRQLEGWRRNGDLALKPVLSLGDAAIILRNDLEASPIASAADRRIYVAFDISPANTNFAMLDAMPIFLDNAVRWLAGGKLRPTATTYEKLNADELAGWRGMVKVVSPQDVGQFDADDFPSPGVYRDERGKFYAVSLDGLKYSSATDDRLTATFELPAPVRMSHPLSPWPILTILAALALLAGWMLRAK